MSALNASRVQVHAVNGVVLHDWARIFDVFRTPDGGRVRAIVANMHE